MDFTLFEFFMAGVLAYSLGFGIGIGFYCSYYLALIIEKKWLK